MLKEQRRSPTLLQEVDWGRPRTNSIRWRREAPTLGLGLWNRPALALGLEALLLFGGIWLYLRRGAALPAAIVAFGLIMLAIQAYVFFGPPPVSGDAAAATALAGYAVFAAVIRQLERRRVPRFGAAT